MRKLVGVVALLGAVACGGTSPVSPRYQPEVVNQPDSFALQLTGVQNGSGSLSYTWQNSGTAASVDRSSSITQGTVTLVIRDAAGQQVYSGPLNGQTGSVPTSPGTPGAWTIEVTFANATGTINFRVQKA